MKIINPKTIGTASTVSNLSPVCMIIQKLTKFLSESLLITPFDINIPLKLKLIRSTISD